MSSEPPLAHRAFINSLRHLVTESLDWHLDDENYTRLTKQIDAMREDLRTGTDVSQIIPGFARQLEGDAAGESPTAVDTGQPTTIPPTTIPPTTIPPTTIPQTAVWSDAFPDSPYSGPLNAAAPPMQVRRDGDEAVGTVICRRQFRGAPDRVHGGLVAALFDDVMGAVLPAFGVPAFTGELTVRYEKGCPINTPLTFRAWVAGREGRKLYVDGEAHSETERFASAKAVFISIDRYHQPT